MTRDWGRMVLLRSEKRAGPCGCLAWRGVFKSCLLPSLAACVINPEKREGGNRKQLLSWGSHMKRMSPQPHRM